MNKSSNNQNNITDTKVTGYKMYKANKKWVFASAVLLSMLGSGLLINDKVNAANIGQEQGVQLVNASKKTEAKAVKATNNNKATNQIAKSGKAKTDKSLRSVIVPQGQLAYMGDKITRDPETGKFSGDFKLHYSGKFEVFAPSVDHFKFAVKVPKEFRKLFSTSRFAGKYIQASYSFEGFGILPNPGMFTEKNMWFDGTYLICTWDKNIASAYSGTTLNIDLDIKLAEAMNETGILVDPPEGSDYAFYSTVKEKNDVITDSDFRYSYGEVIIPGNDIDISLLKITIDEPVYDTDKSVSGKADPTADEVIIYDEEGNILGSTTHIAADGSYTVEIPKQKAGTTITAEEVRGDEKKETTAEVQHKHHEIPAPTVNQPTEGDTTVTGTGHTPGDFIEIKDADGNVISKGKPQVNDDGTYSVELTRPLKPNEKIYVTESDGYDTSDPAEATVKEKAHVEKPTINDITEGDPTITGTGTPGDTVIATLSDGTPLGSAIVGKDGKYEIEINRHITLYAGDEVQVVQKNKDGVESEPATTKVKAIEVDAPVVTPLTAGEHDIKGTGTPGYTVYIYKDKEHTLLLGKVSVDGDGNFSYHSNIPLKAGTTYWIYQDDGKGHQSPDVEVTVQKASKTGADTAKQGNNQVTNQNSK